MRRATRILALSVSAGIVLACTATPPPEIPLNASAAYREKLVGHWAGSYWSADTGRSGSITFTLDEGDGHAHGEVVMIPESQEHFYPASSPRLLTSPQPLRIEIVYAADAQLTGTLEPYKAPNCECVLSTTFVGSIHGDEIRGTFVSLGGAAHRRESGRWEVRRQVE